MNKTELIAAVSANSGLTKKDVCVVEKPTGKKFTFEGADFAYKGSDYAFTVTPQLGYEAAEETDYEIYYERGREGLFCELWIPVKKVVE